MIVTPSDPEEDDRPKFILTTPIKVPTATRRPVTAATSLVTLPTIHLPTRLARLRILHATHQHLISLRAVKRITPRAQHRTLPERLLAPTQLVVKQPWT
jgi:hypothetical protein